MTTFDHDAKHLQEMAEAGDRWAQTALAYAYETGSCGLPVDYVLALQWYRLSAAQNYAYAQDRIGLFYIKGQGVKADYVEAIKWFMLAAEQGDATAIGNVGTMYLRGYGVHANYPMARKWLLEAAELGNATAQAKLGEMAENGWGAAVDIAAAIKWYAAAVKQGNPESLARLKVLSPETLAMMQAEIDARTRLSGDFGNLDTDMPPTRH